MKKIFMALLILGLAGTWAFAAGDSTVTAAGAAKTQNTDQAKTSKAKTTKKKSKKDTSTKKSNKSNDTKEVTAK